MKKKTEQIRKIKSLEKSQREESVAYSHMDYYDECLYKMKNQEIKNLDQLDDFDELINH